VYMPAKASRSMLEKAKRPGNLGAAHSVGGGAQKFGFEGRA
jgi:hypothetical protein